MMQILVFAITYKTYWYFIVFQDMDAEIPEWLSTSYLTDCLRTESKRETIVVTDFKAQSAVPPGNNYGSFVVRVSLNYKDETNSKLPKKLIMKLPLTKGPVKDLFEGITDKEYFFYRDYLPKAQEELKSNFAPKFYPSSSSIQVVVLEDLKEEGYVMADKKQMLDFIECQRYAESASAFHAGSVAVSKKYPELIQSLSSELMFSNEAKSAPSNKNMIRYGLECMADRILKTTGDENTSNIVKKCATALWDILVDALKPTGPINTFNQGDPWITNMMFKYDSEGQCTAVKLLDYQGIRYCTPASDLVWFIWSSGKHYIREEKYDDFFKSYADALNSYLEETKCKERFPLVDLMNDVQKMSPIALWVCALAMPLFLCPSGDPDVESLWGRCGQDYCPENNPYEQYYTEDYCQNQMTRVISQMKQHKIFDYLEMCIGKC